jgi:hypothetical protein
MAMKKSHSKDLTESLKQTELVTLAVYLLGGDVSPVDTEDVAVKAHELAPSRFSWRKYTEQINLELVRVSLSDAMKAKYGARVDGPGEKGWTLTPDGVEWAKRTVDSVPEMNLARLREDGRGGGIQEQRWRRERDRILKTTAWQAVAAGTPVSMRDAQEVFRIDSYAVGRMRILKISRLQALFNEDAKMTAFLDQMANLLQTAGD